MTENMTRADRETLVKLARQRERLAKTEADERAAHLVADFELQLDREFEFDENEIWKQAAIAAETVVADANAKIAAECVRLGIPKEFAPGLSLSWYGKGQNATAGRRAELRRIAKRQIEAATKTARTSIERRSLETQERIMVGGLTSEAARQFLESMPTAASLMPTLNLGQVQALLASPERSTNYDGSPL